MHHWVLKPHNKCTVCYGPEWRRKSIVSIKSFAYLPLVVAVDDYFGMCVICGNRQTKMTRKMAEGIQVSMNRINCFVVVLFRLIALVIIWKAAVGKYIHKVQKTKRLQLYSKRALFAYFPAVFENFAKFLWTMVSVWTGFSLLLFIYCMKYLNFP